MFCITKILDLKGRLDKDFQYLSQETINHDQGSNVSTLNIMDLFKIPRKDNHAQISVEEVIDLLEEFKTKISNMDVPKDKKDDRLERVINRVIIPVQRKLNEIIQNGSAFNIKNHFFEPTRIDQILNMISYNFEHKIHLDYSELYLLYLNHLLSKLSIYTKEMKVGDKIDFDCMRPRDQREYDKPEYDTDDKNLEFHIAYINRYAYLFQEIILLEGDIYAYRVIVK